MPEYPELELAWRDMQHQDSLYQPSVFWRDAARAIADEVTSAGVERFRALEHPLGFFVPTYGPPASGFTVEQAAGLQQWLAATSAEAQKARLALAQFLDGELAARADYRVLVAGDRPELQPFLHQFSESTFGQPVEQFTFDGRRFSRSALNYLLGLALLKRHLGSDVPRTVLEIGGGFGSLGEILAGSGIAEMRYVDLDIPPMHFIAGEYLKAALGADRVATYASMSTPPSIALTTLPVASTLCAWQIERLQGTVDLFVNFISFPEMEPPIVRNYLHHVRRLGARWVMLRNLREGKARRRAGEVGVDEPIVGDDYLTMLPGYTLVDRNVTPYGHETVDHFHSELLILRRDG